MITTSIEPLWKIEERLAELLDSWDICPEENLEELERQINKYLGHEVQKIDRIHAVFLQLDATIANAKQEIERLQRRQHSAELSAKRLEEYVLHVLSRRGGQPLKGENVTFSTRITESVVISDPDLVPAEFKRTTIKVDIPKDPVKRSIKAGREVPGATIQFGEHLVKR